MLALLQHALSLHRSGDVAGAKKLYEEILQQEPHRTEVLYNLALTHIALAEIDPAKATLEKVLETLPEQPPKQPSALYPTLIKARL